jgi:Domain of unknown function (DUF4260)
MPGRSCGGDRRPAGRRDHARREVARVLHRLPRLLLRFEGLVLFAAAIALYVREDFSILALVLLFLAPDLSFVGLAAGARVGAVAYDAVHTYVGPILLGSVSILAEWNVGVQLGLIWLAHIGLDRALGYGLRYPDAFRETHLQRV